MANVRDEWPALVSEPGAAELFPDDTLPLQKDLRRQKSRNELLKGAQKYIEHVKEDKILVYSGALEATEPKTIFLVAMDTKCGKLASATHKKKQ